MKKLTAALLAATAIAMTANAANALDLTCEVPPHGMDPHDVVALRITGQEYGNTIVNLHPVFTLQGGETRDRSVQYVKGWRVEPVASSSGPAIMWSGFYGPGNHRVHAFVKPFDPNDTYREDHYTDKGVLEHKDSFRCWPTGSQPAPQSNNPIVAHNGWDYDHPNADNLREERQADQSNRRYEGARVDGLPDCGDPMVWKVAMKVFSNNAVGHVDESLSRVILPGQAQGISIDRNEGAKTCRVAFRADMDAAKQLDAGLVGRHVLSQIAYNIQQAEAAGNPESIYFRIHLDGEGSWKLQVLNNPEH
jgi:hypothetical protein